VVGLSAAETRRLWLDRARPPACTFAISGQERDNVNQAVAAWHRVGLAQGILMTRRQLKADQAFALLKRESQNTHVKLRTIAQTVIQTGDLPVDR
jgi:AmiR/NasT family two-component response regulator